MKVLITGAKGFIGCHLTEELLSNGYEVVGIDREDGNLLEPGVALELFKKHEPQAIFHLAANVGRLFGEDDVATTIQSNALMTTYVAKACAEVGARMIYASTSEIYGDHGLFICHEDSTPGRVHNLYGLSKKWGEEVCQLYSPERLIILRPSMPIGEGHPPGRGRAALTNILWQAFHKKPIIVHKGAERSWCYVKDSVRGFRMILESGESGVWNVGRDDQKVTMLEAAKRACAYFNVPESLIQEIDPPSNQTVIKRLSMSKLEHTGWRPYIDFSMMIEKIGSWVQNFDETGKKILPK